MVAHDRDAEGAVVEATCVRALDVLVQATVATLVDVAVFVDQRVVAYIAPAQRLCVVGVNAADNGRALRLRVVIGARGVVMQVPLKVL